VSRPLDYFTEYAAQIVHPKDCFTLELTISDGKESTIAFYPERVLRALVKTIQIFESTLGSN
jgi:hypothetical protein